MSQWLVRAATLGLAQALACGCPADEGSIDETEVESGTSDGQESFLERDGMMFVPGGPFWRGCRAEDTTLPDDPVQADHWCEDNIEEHVLLNVPYRQIALSSFWIDKYEVTVEHYMACGEAGSCTAPGGIPWSDVEPPEDPGSPITGITWRQADQYCRWAGKRLPTEAEWEKAARGTDGRRFSWGNSWPECGQAHLFISEDCRTRHVLSVDSHPGDVSPYGVIGMIGNVQEWVHDWAGRNYYQTAPERDPLGPEANEQDDLVDGDKVVRGGYWDSRGGFIFTRRWADWEQPHPGRIGFRCARSEAPP